MRDPSFADWRRATRPSDWLDSLYATLVDASLRGYRLWLADSEARAETPETQRAGLAEWMGRDVRALDLRLPPPASESAAAAVLDTFHAHLTRRERVDDDLVVQLARAHDVLVSEQGSNDLPSGD